MRQLDQIPVPLGSKVNTVRVYRQRESTTVDEQVEQTHARDVRGVTEWLKRRDRRVPRSRIVDEFLRHPRDLIEAAVLIVVEASGVARGVAEFRDASRISEIRVHPRETFGLGEELDEFVATCRLRDVQRRHEDLAHRDPVVGTLVTQGEDVTRDVEPGLANRVRDNAHERELVDIGPRRRVDDSLAWREV
jgi:hypothetical protein